MEKRGEAVQTLTSQEGIEIVDVPVSQRTDLKWILEESFEGWYLRHSTGMLLKIETVRAAMSQGNPVGLVMLKKLENGAGYVYYIAVAKSQRKKGIGKLLLEDALEGFKAGKVKEIFASVESDNESSEALFASEGFKQTSFGEVAGKNGRLRALNMYREMLVVPGEILLHKLIN